MKDPPDVDPSGPDFREHDSRGGHSRAPGKARRKAAASSYKASLDNDAADKTGEKTAGTKNGTAEKAPADDLDISDLANDWIALWQNELVALATDRETQETWHALFALWSGAANAWMRAMPFGLSGNRARNDSSGQNPTRRAGRSAPPPAQHPTAKEERATPASAAPDVRDAEIDRLHRHIADLERRLTDVERRTGKPPTNRRNSGRIGRKR